ncbi:succinyldiaminopimelate transaminase [Orrella daihaiensis]|uniref:Succinyldiaminopimelate transaminase n=1 Tax=Orrella daihaiensis TaxID=2782176 RepID=A0ABY4AJN8_9BURK|nr:succinyldiaminopimelate transaminase [Orrella daihaiensis]UOD49267.1 succinyldiaminopimelate transaminase [Orrella daihaiensis]
MNPRLELLQPYPFEKLRKLLATANPQATGLPLVDLSIGEPKHDAPELAKQAIVNSLAGLSGYPPTKGDPALRTAISGWLANRYRIKAPDPETQVLPVLGSREALFAIAQTVVDPNAGGLVVCPNPFYQIYEGAALLAGAEPFYVNADPTNHFLSDWRSVSPAVWHRTQLLYVCNPGNPAGSVMPLEDWQMLFELADEHDFVIASDECYSEIYLDESQPPLGGLQAAVALGRDDFRRLVSFSSLSKRSNLPGLRSGFVAGDAQIIAKFLLYRTYHGSAMSGVVTAASLAAWQDEEHVRANRQTYREKFDAVLEILGPVMDVQRPQASFYLWARTPYDDAKFTHDLLDQQAVKVLPGSYVSRTADGINPGENRIRIALVAPLADCVEGAKRIASFMTNNP